MSSPTEDAPYSENDDVGYDRLSTYVTSSLHQPERSEKFSYPAAPPLHPSYEALLELHPTFKLDIETLKSWIQHCDEEHGNHCHPASDDAPRFLIDVMEHCLVSPTNSIPTYVALSYVWGDGCPFQTTMDKVQSLQEPHALHEPATHSRIPKTIQDAMRLTSLLGFRYLWVDALCIVQDDDDTKHAELGRMGEIYQGATLTIAAAQGIDSTAGIHFIDEAPVAHTLDTDLHIPYHWNHYRGLVASSAWGHRAWTLQELLFSKRLIFFTAKGALWECHCVNRWSSCPSESNPLHLHVRAYPTPPRPFHDQAWPDLELYCLTVLDYNRRQLTHRHDVVRAFAGITGSLSATFGCFIFGLPALFFDWTLLWQPGALCQTIASKNDQGVSVPPSWSWMSLRGPLDLDMWRSAYDYLDRCQDNETKPTLTVTPLVQWHMYGSSKSQTPITPSYRLHEDAKKPDGFIPSGWKRTADGLFQHASDSGNALTHPIPVGNCTSAIEPYIDSPLISCRAPRAHFKFGKYYYQNGAHDVDVVNADGRPVGFIRVNRNFLWAQRMKGQPCELIAISSGTEEQSSDEPESSASFPCDFHNVLWIEWVGETARRNGLGRVEKSDWAKANVEEADIILG